MKKILIVVFSLYLLFGACKKKNNYIIPVDFNMLFPDTSELYQGLNQDQQQLRMENFIKKLRNNTINHEIPEMTVFNLNGEPQSLSKQLSNTSVIISSGVTCAWNLEGLMNDFLKANKQIENPIDDNQILVLIQTENNEYFKQQFDDNIQEIKDMYSNIFLIDSLTSLKLNLFGFTRYYLSKDHVVKDIGFGTSTRLEILEEEIKRNTAIPLRQ